MSNAIVLATIQHAGTAPTGMPVQYTIQWALISLVLVALAFVLVRTRRRIEDDTVGA